MSFRALRVFYVGRHITCLEVNWIVISWVDSVARTVRLGRSVSSDKLGYQQALAHALRRKWAPLEQLQAAVDNGALGCILGCLLH